MGCGQSSTTTVQPVKPQINASGETGSNAGAGKSEEPSPKHAATTAAQTPVTSHSRSKPANTSNENLGLESKKSSHGGSPPGPDSGTHSTERKNLRDAQNRRRQQSGEQPGSARKLKQSQSSRDNNQRKSNDAGTVGGSTGGSQSPRVVIAASGQAVHIPSDANAPPGSLAVQVNEAPGPAGQSGNDQPADLQLNPNNLIADKRKSNEKRKSARRRTGEKLKRQTMDKLKRRTGDNIPIVEGKTSAPNSPDQAGSPGNRRKPKLVRKASHRGMINQLALQFPAVRRSFEGVRKVFRSYMDSKYGKDKKNQKISLEKLGDVLSHIGEHKKFTPDEVKDLFHLADLDGSKTIEFREFVICIAVGYFLKVDSENEEFKEIQKGFKVVEKAFKDMDDDGSNTVDAEELKNALFATSFKSEKDLLEARFKELDFNGDGDVSFAEFLYGFAQWVGFEDEDEEKENANKPPTPTASVSLQLPPPSVSAGTGATPRSARKGVLKDKDRDKDKEAASAAAH